MHFKPHVVLMVCVLSAMERNNLMRLALTIPFTPVDVLSTIFDCHPHQFISFILPRKTWFSFHAFIDISFWPAGGEEVIVYSLEEVSDVDPESSMMYSWSSQGLSAMLQPLYSEEGYLEGGLRRGCRVLCTWAEQEVLRPGLVYVVKAFRPEVIRSWQKYFHGSAELQLCLRVSSSKMYTCNRQQAIRKWHIYKILMFITGTINW